MMTRAEIVSYTTGKLGITDATAQAQATLFTKQRWAMIWNEEPWIQSRWQENIAVPADTQDVTLGSDFEFMTAGRWADQYELLPMSDLSALAMNPAGYDQAGFVLGFVPLGKDSSGNAKIRLMQKTSTAKNLLAIGKRKCVALNLSTDAPSLPGADQALCEYVMGDLYQWLRQLTKAQAFFSAGQALLDKMKEIEFRQTSNIHRIIPVEQVLDGEETTDWLR